MACPKLNIQDYFSFVKQPETSYRGFSDQPKKSLYGDFCKSTYDGLNRLTKEVSECADNAELQFTDEYTYDLVGNRTQKIHTANVNETIGYTFNNNDQLTLESNSVKGDTVYTYDANGSQIGKVNTTQNESYMYAYNLQNRLSTATITRTETEPMGVSKLVDITSSYVYNQSGIRVGANTSTTIDGGTAEIKDTVYLTDPSNFTGYSQVIEESVNGTLTKSYTLGDDVLAQTVGATTSYLQYDGHGSTRLLTNNSSAIANRFDYDAYGKNLFSANVTNPSATDMLYSGEQYDSELQMQYLRARYYDQSNGRFNRVDPFNGNMGDPQSLHKYGYCHGNPVMGIDPSGLFTLTNVLASIGIINVLSGLMLGAITDATGDRGFSPDIAIYGFSYSFSSTLSAGGALLPLGAQAGMFTAGIGASIGAMSNDASLLSQAKTYGMGMAILNFSSMAGLITQGLAYAPGSVISPLLTGGITVGIELVVHAKTKTMGYFVYMGPSGSIGTGAIGQPYSSFSFYMGVGWGMDKLSDYRSFPMPVYSIGGSAAVGNFGGGFNLWRNPDYSQYGQTASFNITNGPGVNANFGVSWSKGPFQVQEGAGTVMPYLMFAQPVPLNFGLMQKAAL